MNKEFDEALQSCLDLIRGGRETIESVVARYPEFADELRAQLEIVTWLTSASDAFDPRPGFVSASRRRLVSRIQGESRPPEPVPLTWGERIQQIFSTQMLAPVGFVLVVVLALIVSGTVVSASRKTIPGDDLYSVKLTLEKIALAASLDEKTDAELSIQMVENRFTEMTSLMIEQNYDDVLDTIDESAEQISNATQIIKRIETQDRLVAVELANKLDGILKEQQNILNALAENSPNIIQLNLSRVVAASTFFRLSVSDITDILPPPPAPPPTAVPTAIPTSTPRPRPTLGPTQPPAPTDTPTRKPPTAVPPTSTPLPTNTPVPPTNTPLPTATPTATNRPPPTNTPTAPPPPTATTVTVLEPTATPTP